MGFFEFFRKKKEVESRIIRKVSIDEISNEIEELFKELENKLQIVGEEINKNLALVIDNLRAQTNVLKLINLEHRREDEKIKRIVSENLGFYISHLENLINEFEKTKNLEVKDCLSKIQLILEDFYKKSYKSYEKATILIGEEIGQVKEIIKNFNKEFVKTLQESDSVFIKIKFIEEVKELNNKIKNLGKIKEEIDKQIKSLKELREELEKQKSFFEEGYYKFKQSEEFKKILMLEQRFNEELIDFNNEVLKIKEKIDIKFLLKYYHNDPKHHRLLKSYRENFIETLENDEVSEIVKLVEKARNIDIKKEILNLKEKNRNLKMRDNLPAKAKLKIFEDKIKNIDLEISDLEKRESAETRKFERFKNKETSLINEKINKAKEIIEDIEIANET